MSSGNLGSSMTIHSLVKAHGQEVHDPEEGTVPLSFPSSAARASTLSSVLESFLLFSQAIPSQNLGFVDSKAARLELTIADRDLSIVQSPTILSSNRGGGTTGAGEDPRLPQLPP